MNHKSEFTKNHLDMILSKNGQINKKQLTIIDEILIGRTKGWKKKLIGRWINTEQLNTLIKLKNTHLQPEFNQNREWYEKSEWNKKYLDPKWQKKKSEIMIRDGFVCKWCGEDKITLHVHHTKYHAEPWSTPNEYLVTICEKCHGKHHKHIKRHDKQEKLIKKWL